MAGAYYEKIARINLTSGDIKVEQLDPALAHEFIGGRGLAAKILYDEGIATVDPLSPENKFLCVTGPMTGAVAPSSGRYTLATKSPITEKFTSSNSGGIWGAKLKFAGWDAIIIEGQAKEWSYISIEDSSIWIHDARRYVGTLTTDLDKILKDRHGADSSVLSIGPAGEKEVLLAAVMNDKIRAAGRGGIGAVMGSKKLKAIVVKTSRTHLDTITDLDALKASTGRALNIIRENSATDIGLRSLDTDVIDSIINCVASLSANSWYLSPSTPEKEFSNEELLASPGGCYRCPIACSRAGKTTHKFQHQPDNNTTIFDLCNILCNEYGLDTIGFHRAIVAATELYQRGTIQENECDGTPLEWNTLVEWAKRIGNPKTTLDWHISSGADHLCEHYGIPEISRKKKPVHKDSSGRTTDLSQQSNCTAEDEKTFRDLSAVIDSMGQCLFTSSTLSPQEYASLLNAVTGTNRTMEQMLEIGNHIHNVERMFNKAANV